MTLKFDINKVICINIKSLNEQQLFSTSENFRINFEVLIEIKKENYCPKIWLEKNGDWVIAYTTKDRPNEIVVSEKFLPLTKKERQQLENIKPIQTPKMPQDDSCLSAYQYFLNKGYNIRTKSLDDKLERLSNSESDYIPNTHKSKIDSVKQTNIELDYILDKISQSGIDSLTREELLYLIKYK